MISTASSVVISNKKFMISIVKMITSISYESIICLPASLGLYYVRLFLQ